METHPSGLLRVTNLTLASFLPMPEVPDGIYLPRRHLYSPSCREGGCSRKPIYAPVDLMR
jgi:hypothetical protein